MHNAALNKFLICLYPLSLAALHRANFKASGSISVLEKKLVNIISGNARALSN